MIPMSNAAFFIFFFLSWMDDNFLLGYYHINNKPKRSYFEYLPMRKRSTIAKAPKVYLLFDFVNVERFNSFLKPII